VQFTAFASRRRRRAGRRHPSHAGPQPARRSRPSALPALQWPSHL